jgi:hypothetical protein
MKPVTADILAHLLGQPHRNELHTLFMLNLSMLGVRYVSQVVEQHGPGNVRTKGGLSLPLEVWQMIFDASLPFNSYDESDRDEYSMARAKIIATSRDYIIVSCVQLTVTKKKAPSYFGECKQLSSIPIAWLGDWNNPDLYTLEPDPKTRRHLIVKVYRDPGRLSCLFSQLTQQDYLARIEHGICRCCGGQRLLPSQCTDPEIAWVRPVGPYNLLDLHQVPAPCPVCIGDQFTKAHHRWLIANGYDPACDFNNHARDTQLAWLCTKLYELGYSVKTLTLLNSCRPPRRQVVPLSIEYVSEIAFRAAVDVGVPDNLVKHWLRNWGWRRVGYIGNRG